MACRDEKLSLDSFIDLPIRLDNLLRKCLALRTQAALVEPAVMTDPMQISHTRLHAGKRESNYATTVASQTMSSAYAQPGGNLADMPARETGANAVPPCGESHYSYDLLLLHYTSSDKAFRVCICTSSVN